MSTASIASAAVQPALAAAIAPGRFGDLDER